MWVWCSQCHRCYLDLERRRINGRFVCAYADCAGTFLSSTQWEMVRLLHPEYPPIPARNTRYRVPEVSFDL
jgi:hypothetical protein